jgi:hypothetical protein
MTMVIPVLLRSSPANPRFVHSTHWNSFAASDIAEVKQLLGVPADRAITDEAVVRWLVWPDAGASLPPYLASGR